MLVWKNWKHAFLTIYQLKSPCASPRRSVAADTPPHSFVTHPWRRKPTAAQNLWRRIKMAEFSQIRTISDGALAVRISDGIWQAK